jgi:uncharacterized protein YlxW (UPF0749 family)
MVLGLCIASVMTFSVNAQQTPPKENPNRARIQQLRQEMQALRQQLEPLRAQVRALREKMRPIEEKLKADREEMRDLRGHGQYHAGAPAEGQGQLQHPSGAPTHTAVN